MRPRNSNGYEKPISPKELREAGWTKTAGYRSYVHETGWSIQHCGHPTANWPYALFDPTGRMYRQGARVGKPDCGYAWPTVRQAVDYVATVLC